MTGVEPNYSEIRFVPVAEGRFLRSDDLEQRRRVVVMGKKTAALLFPGRPALGEWVLLNGITIPGDRGGRQHRARQQ